MPVINIEISSEASELLGFLESEGPQEMNRAIFEGTPSAQEIIKKGFAVYEDGALKLVKDCRDLKGGSKE